ncbi:MAG: DUF3131 domain-containing protein, partial [Calditrichaeota bacterium]
MTFREGLIYARSYLVFLAGLIAAFGIIIYLESVEVRFKSDFVVKQTMDITPPSPAPLTEEELRWARIAWKYFQNNYQPTTGLVNSVDKYPASTMWDTSSYLLGLIAAYRLGIIDRATFDERLSRALNALAELPLFDGKLPNKSYNTITLEMVNYNNEKTDRGIGWSAIDIGRVLVPLNIIVWNYPRHTDEVARILARWDFSAMLRDGVLYGAAVDEQGNTVYVQEGRIGYEEYAAKSLSLMGMDVFEALEYQDYLKYVNVYGVKIPTDSRDPEVYHAHNYVVSESYILDGLEFGWDGISREFAYRVYKAQELRYRHTGQLTAVSEDNIDQPPYFVYNTVFTSGKVWNCITEDGKDASQFRTISTKAAFGWYCLYQTDYTRRVMEAVKELYDPQR